MGTGGKMKEEVSEVLQQYLHRDVRLRVWYGNPDTGKAWPEEFDVVGYVGRSTAFREENKIYLLVHSRRSMGGPAMLVDHIVRIDRTDTGRTLYEHAHFDPGTYTIDGTEVERDGDLVARFGSRREAEKYVQFMRGERYTKGGK